jgi:adenylate kinase
MLIAITGTPGCGKSTLAKNLASYSGYTYLNEKDFALQNKIGVFTDENELEIPVPEFTKKLNIFLKNKKNFIIEGHVICESKLKVDKIIVIKINPEELELRLEKRGYSTQKIMDNVFCEGIDYCNKHVKKNYSKTKIIQIASAQNPQITLALAIKALNLTKKAQ